MDLYIDRDAFSHGLTRVQGIVERRSTNRILSSVLLEADNDCLRMTATDTEVAFTGDLGANVTSPGAIAVDASHLFQITKALPDNTVHLVLGPNNRLEISSGSAWFKMVGSPPEEYPPLPEFTGTATLTMPASGLKWLIDRTHFCVCSDDNRYGINGAHLELSSAEDGPRLRMVGTDGHRLGFAEAGFTGDFGMPSGRLLPRKALGEMKKLSERGDEELSLSFSDNGALLQTGEGRFFFRLIDGEFPGYREVIPAASQRRVTINRAALLAAVKRVGLLASDQTRPVRFAFEGDHVTLSTQNLDIGEAREEVPCEFDGDDITVGFNGRYFSEALAATCGDHVLIELTDPLMPALLREQDQDEGLFVIMPMRLD